MFEKFVGEMKGDKMEKAHTHPTTVIQKKKKIHIIVGQSTTLSIRALAVIDL